jgi:NAD(P)-dependent dehydrogenase (short-subunit alcohol dehydrogenase family)
MKRAAELLKKYLQESLATGDGTCNFTRVDVRDYQAQLALFDTAYKEHGNVDMAVYSAGINVMAATGSIVAAENNLETVREVRI